MNIVSHEPVRIAIACGGTGGHLFPGIAVGEELTRRGCAVSLLISPKEIDQYAAKAAAGMEVLTLPAVGLSRRRVIAFTRGFARSYQVAKRFFRDRPPDAALAMGGFTSAPPLLAAKRLGALTFLHESNTVPGRANRWLSWVVWQAFVGFPCAARRLHTPSVTITGTPVRSQFQPGEAAARRVALGLDPGRPVVLVMGGSQGASGLNDLVLRTLPLLTTAARDWQWVHLAGAGDYETVRQAYAASGLRAAVHPFLREMELALGAASAAVSRAGAASLAELAAMRLPAVLVPFPAATDNHQWHNARAFEENGAARLLRQRGATGEMLARLLVDLVTNDITGRSMRRALAEWHRPLAAVQIAEHILEGLRTQTGAARVSLGQAHRSGAPGGRGGLGRSNHAQAILRGVPCRGWMLARGRCS